MPAAPPAPGSWCRPDSHARRRNCALPLHAELVGELVGDFRDPASTITGRTSSWRITAAVAGHGRRGGDDEGVGFAVGWMAAALSPSALWRVRCRPRLEDHRDVLGAGVVEIHDRCLAAVQRRVSARSGCAGTGAGAVAGKQDGVGALVGNELAPVAAPARQHRLPVRSGCARPRRWRGAAGSLTRHPRRCPYARSAPSAAPRCRRGR